MTAIGTENHPGVHRCAVCKIDRKGRFILADSSAQSLFGLTEVQLFGRPLTDFVDAGDHALIEAVTANRNPYETVFNAIPVTLLDQKGQPRAATLIVSVNFGGGNPANYQIIIHTDQPRVATAVPTSDQPWPAYLEYLVQSDQIDEPDQLAQRLINLDGITSVALYDTLVHPDNLLVQTDQRGGTGDSDSAYSEEDGDLEFIRASFTLSNGHAGLALLKADETDHDSGPDPKWAELAAVALNALCPVSDHQVSDDGSPGLTAAGRFLDQLDIGALEVDREGRVSHRNEAFGRLFDETSELSSLDDFIDILETRGDPVNAASLAAYCHALSICEAPPRLQLNLKLDQIGPVTLTYERFNPVSEDRSGCFLFSRVDMQVAWGRDIVSAPVDLALNGLDRMRSSMAAARSIWLRLEHEHANELSGDGAFYLRSLSLHLDTVEQTLIDLEKLLKSATSIEPPQTVNLDLLISKIISELETRPTGPAINLRCSDLPTIRSQLEKLTSALRYTIEAMTPAAAGAEVELRLAAAVADGNVTLTVGRDVPRLTKKQARRAFVYAGPSTAVQDATGSNRPIGLAQARALIESLGGQLSLDSDSGTGLAVRIIFPEM